MAEISIVGNEILGMTSGEHSGHIPPHSPCTITGNISTNHSNFVFINNTPIALVGYETNEYDCCCGSNKGIIGEGSSKIFVNNIPIARVGDKINTHNGTANIYTGCGFIEES